MEQQPTPTTQDVFGPTLRLCGGFLLGSASASAQMPPKASPSPITVSTGQRAYDLGDFSRAYAVWIGLAKQGDDVADMDLAAMLDQGEGVHRDAEAALRWYRVAAEHGLPEAELDVGIMLDSGRGTSRDVAEAAIWYARAATHGQPRAQYNLGQLYDAGEGVPRNPDAARAWYRLAAANGVHAAVARLASPPGHFCSTATRDRANVVLQAPAGNASVYASARRGEMEFVWAAPAQPVPVTYFIEVAAISSSGARPVVSRYVIKTAVALDLGAATGQFAWRIYVIDQKRQQYALGGWKHFSLTATGAAG